MASFVLDLKKKPGRQFFSFKKHKTKEAGDAGEGLKLFQNERQWPPLF